VNREVVMRVALVLVMMSGTALAQPGLTPPVPVAPDARALRSGSTFEAGIGLGLVRSDSDETGIGLGGFGVGVGSWFGPQFAVSARLAGVSAEDGGRRGNHMFLGPSLQWWLNDHIWLAGGLGLAILAVGGDDVDVNLGLGVDLRAGVTLTSGKQDSFNLSLELTPSRYDGAPALTGIAVMLGYQHL
jgi:hypothetical protein